MDNYILKLENIVKSFPGVLALSDMHFNLLSAEIHAICGENGAGKSTLMKVITGVYPPDSGDIYLNNQKCNFKNPNDSFDKGISIIYQETSLFEEMTILDNIFLGHEKQKKIAGAFSILDYNAMKEAVINIFKTLNTYIDPNKKIKELGMAQKQMVEIAKALTFNSKILILDEPTASLTNREVDALFNVIKKLKSNNVGVVYISHRMEEIFEICDRVTVIRDGKYISCKDVAATTKDEIVKDMVGRDVQNYYVKPNTEVGNEVINVSNINIKNLLKNISFKINQGEIVGFAGIAGAGRTELAQAICGLRKIDGGKIFIEQKEISIKTYKDAQKNGVVYVSEDRGKYGLIVDMSVKHNMTMPQLENFSHNGIINDNSEDTITEKYINELSIKAPNNNFLAANLSGGNQQKISISKALALNPKLLILDEPTRGVDINAKIEIHNIIANLVSKGLTIFMISSELPELISMCDRMYIMKDGMIKHHFDHDNKPTQKEILEIALSSNN